MPLEEGFQQLQALAQTRNTLRLKEIVEAFKGQGLFLIIIFLVVPFCTPFQIPGLSTPFGLAIAFLGLRLTCGSTRLFLPKTILEKEISSLTLQKIVDKALWVVYKIHHLIRRRPPFLAHSALLKRINGGLLLLLGLLLALPLPLPLTNLLAAWPILLIALGTLEEDGIFLVLGYVCACIALVGLFVVMDLLIGSIFLSQISFPGSHK